METESISRVYTTRFTNVGTEENPKWERIDGIKLNQSNITIAFRIKWRIKVIVLKIKNCIRKILKGKLL